MRRRVLALSALLAVSILPAARGQDASVKTDPDLPKFRVEAVLCAYEPVSERRERFAEFLYGSLTAEWVRGGFAAKAEVRGRAGLFRPYYDGSVWLEEGWVSCATPIGAVRVGKLQRDVGLADESFSGTLFTANGVTRNPDWGAGLAGEKRLGYDTLGWSASAYGQNDRVSWEDDGRGVESDPTRVLRDGLEARVFYLVNKGLWSLKPAVSVASAALDRRDGAGSFRRTDVALDVTATLGPIALLLEGFARSGERCVPGAPCRLGYDDATAGLVGFRAEFPSVTYRYLYSVWRYRGAEATEALHLPGVVWMPRKGLAATIEYSARSMRTLSGTAVVKAFQLGLSVVF
ncbi:MAG: hypothetical protein NEA02_15615 [Thermoanaerobaculia bacterium]|nr:hypothetical protein [Thermoanaerobaculia bacterium]